MSDLRSPNEMLEAAVDMMLDGRQPATEEDWVLVVNFLAANIHQDVVAHAMPVLKMIYTIPLSDEYIAEIVRFQISQRDR